MSKLTPDLQNHCTVRKHNGQGVRFWHDSWAPAGILKDVFAAAYKACSNKYIHVADMI